MGIGTRFSKFPIYILLIVSVLSGLYRTYAFAEPKPTNTSIQWLAPEQETYKVILPFKEPETALEKFVLEHNGDIKYMNWVRTKSDLKLAKALSKAILTPNLTVIKSLLDILETLKGQEKLSEFVPLEDMRKYAVTKLSYQGTIDPTKQMPQPVFYQEGKYGNLILIEKTSFKGIVLEKESLKTSSEVLLPATIPEDFVTTEPNQGTLVPDNELIIDSTKEVTQTLERLKNNLGFYTKELSSLQKSADKKEQRKRKIVNRLKAHITGRGRPTARHDPTIVEWESKTDAQHKQALSLNWLYALQREAESLAYEAAAWASELSSKDMSRADLKRVNARANYYLRRANSLVSRMDSEIQVHRNELPAGAYQNWLQMKGDTRMEP